MRSKAPGGEVEERLLGALSAAMSIVSLQGPVWLNHKEQVQVGVVTLDWFLTY